MFKLIITLAKTEPLVGFFIGIILLVTVGLTNWYGNIKANTIKWLAITLYVSSPSREKQADGMFMVLTSIVLCLGGILLLLSTLYLL